jgi:hypothetical protein
MEMKINSEMTAQELKEAVRKVSEASDGELEIIFISKRDGDTNYSVIANCSAFMIADAVSIVSSNIQDAIKVIFRTGFEEGTQVDQNKKDNRIVNLHGREQ